MTGADSLMLRHEGRIGAYLAEIRHFPMLDEAIEHELAKQYRDAANELAAHRLITSHLRLSAKIALSYRGYGLPLSDLISEGNLGLVKAVKRFDPDRGARFATYAIWWIRAQIQEYVLRSWSLVKIGTTAAQKTLFFNLARSKARLRSDGGELSPADAQMIATKLGVSEAEVVSMNGRLSARDTSLNVPSREGDGAWEERIADEGDDQEERLAKRETVEARRLLMRHALTQLRDREREIIEARHLREEPLPLVVIAKRYGLSPERIRQIELNALAKLQKTVRQSSHAPTIVLSRAA